MQPIDRSSRPTTPTHLPLEESAPVSPSRQRIPPTQDDQVERTEQVALKRIESASSSPLSTRSSVDDTPDSSANFSPDVSDDEDSSELDFSGPEYNALFMAFSPAPGPAVIHSFKGTKPFPIVSTINGTSASIKWDEKGTPITIEELSKVLVLAGKTDLVHALNKTLQIMPFGLHHLIQSVQKEIEEKIKILQEFVETATMQDSLQDITETPK